jgi:glycosyltransferase involved in cell wall biosynthesis
MQSQSGPSISVVIATYQADQWLGQALDSILDQTRAADEVIVVDDGSTDGTAGILDGYGDRIRVIRQDNAGYPTAMNRAIREASGEFVAPCGADDIWEPRKLEWQAAAARANPEVGVLFGHAIMFGRAERDFVRPTETELLDGAVLLDDLFRMNPINMPSTLIRRDLFGPLGWFTDGFLADDLEFFFRCLRAGVRFYYEPRTLVRYRLHDHNITNNNTKMHEATHLVHVWNFDQSADPRTTSEVIARDQLMIARAHADEGHRREARRAYRKALRHGAGSTFATNLRAAAWLAILSLPSRSSQRLGQALAAARGTLLELRDGRQKVTL